MAQGLGEISGDALFRYIRRGRQRRNPKPGQMFTEDYTDAERFGLEALEGELKRRGGGNLTLSPDGFEGSGAFRAPANSVWDSQTGWVPISKFDPIKQALQGPAAAAPQAPAAPLYPSSDLFSPPSKAQEDLLAGPAKSVLKRDLPFFDELARRDAEDIEAARQRYRGDILADQDLFAQAGREEGADIEAGRQRFARERGGDVDLFTEAGRLGREDLEGARNRLYQQSLDLLPLVSRQVQDIFKPQFEENLRRSRDLLGAQGIVGDFGSSGVFQELGARESRNLTSQALSRALEAALPGLQQANALGVEAARIPGQFRGAGLERRLGNEDIFSQAGLEASRAQSPFRRAGLERRLRAGDIFGEMGVEAALTRPQARRSLLERLLEAQDIEEDKDFQRYMAGQGIQANLAAAREARRGAERGAIYGAIGDIVGRGLGGYLGIG